MMKYMTKKEKVKKKIVVDESISTEKLSRFEAYARKKGFWNPECLLIGKQHAGMPDVHIIYHLLDPNTISVNSDRLLHKRILSKGLKSYYVSEEIITDKPLKGLKSKPVIVLNKNDLVVKDSYHQPKTEIRSLLLPSSSRHLKKLYTRSLKSCPLNRYYFLVHFLKRPFNSLVKDSSNSFIISYLRHLCPRTSKQTSSGFLTSRIVGTAFPHAYPTSR